MRTMSAGCRGFGALFEKENEMKNDKKEQTKAPKTLTLDDLVNINGGLDYHSGHDGEVFKPSREVRLRKRG